MSVNAITSALDFFKEVCPDMDYTARFTGSVEYIINNEHYNYYDMDILISRDSNCVTINIVNDEKLEEGMFQSFSTLWQEMEYLENNLKIMGKSPQGIPYTVYISQY